MRRAARGGMGTPETMFSTSRPVNRPPAPLWVRCGDARPARPPGPVLPGGAHTPDRARDRRRSRRPASDGRREPGVLLQRSRGAGRPHRGDRLRGQGREPLPPGDDGHAASPSSTTTATDWLDVFLVNGTTLEGFPKGQEPTNHLYRNRGDGTFEDTTARAGVGASGWGQGACAGDYDNDGHEDLFVTYYGQNRLYRNRGDGTFDGRHRAGGPRSTRARAGAPAARSSTTTATASSTCSSPNYIDLDLATAPTPDSRPLPLQGRQGGVRPARPAGRQERPLPQPRRRHLRGRLGQVRDHEGQRDLRPGREHARLRRRRLGRRLRRQRLEPERALPQQPRRHVHRRGGARRAAPTARTASRRRAWASPSATTTATAPWTSSRRTSPATPRPCTRTAAQGFCEDRTFAAGIGVNTRWLGWGTAFVDFDNDGWLDLFLANGHVYPEVAQLQTEAGYAQRKVVYREPRATAASRT